MTLIISVDVKQKLIKEDFNDDCKMLKHLQVLLQSFINMKSMHSTKKYYMLSLIDFKSHRQNGIPSPRTSWATRAGLGQSAHVRPLHWLSARGIRAGEGWEIRFMLPPAVPLHCPEIPPLALLSSPLLPPARSCSLLRLILVKLRNCFLWCERHICLLLTFYSLLD